MFKSIRLRNFKGYKDSKEIPLKPLTILVGKNNAGKSSIIHALLLLKQTLDDASSAALVTTGPLVELNGFYDILHGKRHSLDSQNEHIGIDIKLTPAEVIGLEFGKAVFKDDKKEVQREADQIDLDFIFSDKANEIQVSRCRMLNRGEVIFDVRNHGRNWSCGDWTEKTHPYLKVNFVNFLPVFQFDRKATPSKMPPEVAMKAQSSFWHKLLWDNVFDRLFRVGPVRQRMPWYTGIGTRTSSEFGQGGENLVNALGSKEKVAKTKATLLELVDSWVSGKLQVLKKLRMANVDEAGLVRMLLGDEIHGPEGVSVAAMGEGVSQLLPVIARTILGTDGQSLIVEQPEIHLHPGLQADLADLFIEATSSTERQVIIETHSEHLLLRIRRRIAEGTIKPEHVAIIYVEKNGPESTARELVLNGKGHFDDWPKGFFEESYQEAMALAMAVAHNKPK